MKIPWPLFLLVLLLLVGTGCAGSSAQVRTEHPPEHLENARPRATEYGIASWYGRKYHGRLTASGERYNMYDYTAAHRTLPFGTFVRVTSLSTDRRVLVRINDRGPFVRGRVIDLSYKAAKDMAMLETGLEDVRLEILTR
jgi:rare lipoprotein A